VKKSSSTNDLNIYKSNKYREVRIWLLIASQNESFLTAFNNRKKKWRLNRKLWG